MLQRVSFGGAQPVGWIKQNAPQQRRIPEKGLNFTPNRQIWSSILTLNHFFPEFYKRRRQNQVLQDLKQKHPVMTQPLAAVFSAWSKTLFWLDDKSKASVVLGKLLRGTAVEDRNPLAKKTTYEERGQKAHAAPAVDLKPLEEELDEDEEINHNRCTELVEVPKKWWWQVSKRIGVWWMVRGTKRWWARWRGGDKDAVVTVPRFFKINHTRKRNLAALEKLLQLWPRYNREEFLQEMEHLLPVAVEALLKGDEVLLRGACTKQCAAKLLPIIIATKKDKRSECHLLDVTGIELVEAELRKNTPILRVQFQTQETSCYLSLTDPNLVVEGAQILEFRTYFCEVIYDTDTKNFLVHDLAILPKNPLFG
jgi:hypothetical protein